eukprot:8851688-Heterocapsa_arctica.AAC.1
MVISANLLSTTNLVGTMTGCEAVPSIEHRSPAFVNHVLQETGCDNRVLLGGAIVSPPVGH